MIGNKLKKYSIDDYFVGELGVSFSFNAFNENDANKIDGLEFGGAINLGKELEYDNNNRHYIRYLALFRRNGNECKCLNYEFLDLYNGLDFYKNQMSLRNCLPKVGYIVPNEINKKEAMILFNTLFKRTKFRTPISLYPRYEWDATACFSSDQYYGGTLNLCTGYKSDGKYELFNLVDECLLKAIGAKEEKPIEVNDDEKVYIYKKYLCLFLAQEEQKILNLCNNQYYKVGTINNMLPFNKYQTSIDQRNYICGKTDARKALTNFMK